MAAWVDVDGGAEGLDVNGLFDAPFDPILLRCDDGSVIFAEVVPVNTCMLKHCRLVVSKSIGGGRCVLLEPSIECAFGFSNIPAWARYGVGTSAGYVVDKTCLTLFFELILGVDE